VEGLVVIAPLVPDRSSPRKEVRLKLLAPAVVRFRSADVAIGLLRCPGAADVNLAKSRSRTPPNASIVRALFLRGVLMSDDNMPPVHRDILALVISAIVVFAAFAAAMMVLDGPS